MQFQDLKGQMSRLHNTEHQRLVKLTMLCDAALKDLKAKRAKVDLWDYDDDDDDDDCRLV